MNESFIFYKSFYESIKNLPPENQLEVYDAICQYSLNGVEPENLSGVASAIFILIKPNIDSAQKSYKASIENGKKGGRPRKESKEKPNKNQIETEMKPNENLNQTQTKPNKKLDKDMDKDKDKDMDKDMDVDVELKLQQRFIECTSSTNMYAISECISFLNELPFEVIELALVKTSEKNRTDGNMQKLY